jgi:hypothetical protein
LEFLERLDRRLAAQSQLGGSARGFGDAAILPFVRQFVAVDRGWFDAQPLDHLRNGSTITSHPACSTQSCCEPSHGSRATRRCGSSPRTRRRALGPVTGTVHSYGDSRRNVLGAVPTSPTGIFFARLARG